MNTAPDIRCPNCGSCDVRDSYRRTGLWEVLLDMFNLVPYRCRACGNRFHGRPWEEDYEEEVAE
jgi:DNA-directed RNA polymerase subunit RPC12/RpoP